MEWHPLQMMDLTHPCTEPRTTGLWGQNDTMTAYAPYENNENDFIVIIIIIKTRLQPRLESYKLYTQGYQQGKQSSKEKEKK